MTSLPASLLDIAETLGIRVALVLMREFGGREVRIPKSAPSDHALAKALGVEDAAALCHFLADQVIYVPHGRIAARHRAVGELAAKGKTRGEIARLLGLSERHVRRLAGSADPRQDDLFPETED